MTHDRLLIDFEITPKQWQATVKFIIARKIKLWLNFLLQIFITTELRLYATIYESQHIFENCYLSRLILTRAYFSDQTQHVLCVLFLKKILKNFHNPLISVDYSFVSS